ncbi:MAG: chemotaxis protein CheW [Nitrospinae bacterium]|nr:chemotaxis protein CheW [Nitrospinota bacterium]
MEIAVSSFAGALEIMEFEIDEKGPDGATINGLYGINVSKVGEVIKIPEKISPTAMDHPAIEGVIDLRGEVIPVINLPKWLGKYYVGFKYERIIIVEFNDLKAGLIVSRVNRIHKVPYDHFTPPTAIMRGGSKLATSGVVRNEGRLLLVIDYENLMTDIDEDAFADYDEIPAATGRGGTVMVIDDSAMVRGVLKNVFIKAGYRVLEAENGADAMALLDEKSAHWEKDGVAAEDALSAVVTDMEMPLMDGALFVKRMKSDKRFKNVPIAVFSSVVSDEMKGGWISAGASAVVAKPGFAELVGYVNQFSVSSSPA